MTPTGKAIHTNLILQNANVKVLSIVFDDGSIWIFQFGLGGQSWSCVYRPEKV